MAELQAIEQVRFLAQEAELQILRELINLKKELRDLEARHRREIDELTHRFDKLHTASHSEVACIVAKNDVDTNWVLLRVHGTACDVNRMLTDATRGKDIRVAAIMACPSYELVKRAFWEHMRSSEGGWCRVRVADMHQYFNTPVSVNGLNLTWTKLAVY